MNERALTQAGEETVSPNAGDAHLSLDLSQSDTEGAASFSQRNSTGDQPAQSHKRKDAMHPASGVPEVDPIATQGWSGKPLAESPNANLESQQAAEPSAAQGSTASGLAVNPVETAHHSAARASTSSQPAEAANLSPLNNPAPEADFRPREARTATITRNTTETQIALRLNLDGYGTYTVSTGIRFFDHMLELFTRHGGFDLDLHCTGDLDVDQHHTVEDVGIALGEAFDQALGDKKGILRAGYFVMPMDETLAVAAVDLSATSLTVPTLAATPGDIVIAAIDLSGRTSCVVDDQVNVPIVGDFQTELLTDFFDGFARGARANVHVKTMYGRSNHHKIEAIFKAFARALRGAVSRDERMKDLLPSTKGLL